MCIIHLEWNFIYFPLIFLDDCTKSWAHHSSLWGSEEILTREQPINTIRKKPNAESMGNQCMALIPSDRKIRKDTFWGGFSKVIQKQVSRRAWESMKSVFLAFWGHMWAWANPATDHSLPQQTGKHELKDNSLMRLHVAGTFHKCCHQKEWIHHHRKSEK